MKASVTYQIGDIGQAYDGCIGRVIYTLQRTDTAFLNEQRVWIKRPNGRVVDAAAAYFQAVDASRLAELTKTALPAQVI